MFNVHAYFCLKLFEFLLLNLSTTLYLCDKFAMCFNCSVHQIFTTWDKVTIIVFYFRQMAFKLNMYLFLVLVMFGALHAQDNDEPNPMGKLFRRRPCTCCLPVNSYICLESLGLSVVYIQRV